MNSIRAIVVTSPKKGQVNIVPKNIHDVINGYDLMVALQLDVVYYAIDPVTTDNTNELLEQINKLHSEVVYEIS